MELELFLRIFVALVPVLGFLIVFSLLDTIDLLPAPFVALLCLVGAGVAYAAYLVNASILTTFPIALSDYSRFGAPFVEEALKATPIIVLFHRNRLGYKLDAGIAGFAIGAGFAVVENLWFLLALTDTNLSTWLVRGLGTAVMHGGATAIFALVSHEMTERQAEGVSAAYKFKSIHFVPGFLAASVVHGLFNYFSAEPIMVMVLTLLLVPLVLFLSFFVNQKATGDWLKKDSDIHRKMLADIEAGTFASSKNGLAIKKVVGYSLFGNLDDTFRYVKLKIELVLRAEELILSSQDEEAIEVGDDVLEMFVELMNLESRIGPITLMEIEPYLGLSRNDLWELGRLRQAVEMKIY